MNMWIEVLGWKLITLGAVHTYTPQDLTPWINTLASLPQDTPEKKLMNGQGKTKFISTTW
jgi:hypothetical protein